MYFTIIGMIVFACTFGGALVGMWLCTMLPDNYLNAESRDIIKLGIGFVAMMIVFVLGFVIAFVKSSFDMVNTVVK